MVYLYEYDDPSVATRAQQSALSRVLIDLKDKYGDEVVLVPIAHDTGVKSLDLLIENYGVREFPSVIVNGEHVVSGLVGVEELEGYLVS